MRSSDLSLTTLGRVAGMPAAEEEPSPNRRHLRAGSCLRSDARSASAPRRHPHPRICPVESLRVLHRRIRRRRQQPPQPQQRVDVQGNHQRETMKPIIALISLSTIISCQPRASRDSVRPERRGLWDVLGGGSTVCAKRMTKPVMPPREQSGGLGGSVLGGGDASRPLPPRLAVRPDGAALLSQRR